MQNKVSNTPHAGPVRWGILGTGRIARDFVRGLRHAPQAHLAAAGSRSLERAAKFAAEFGAARSHGSYEALVADPGVDVVYIATPHSRHKDDCLLALAAGKAVLCEKPFAVTAAEAEQVIQVARQRGQFCMEAMWMRFIPAIRRASELVREGAIGKVRMLTADFGVPTVYDPANRFFNPALGGGALLDRCVYPLALASELFGAPKSLQSTACLAPTGVDEQVAVLLQYSGGQIAAVSATLTGYAANEAVIIGTRGRITIHEPLCRPDRLTLCLAPTLDDRPAPADSIKERLKSGLRESALARRLRRLLPGRCESLYLPYQGNGYGHEAEEVGRCLAAGRTESGLLPLNETLAMMRTLDDIRAQWSIGSD